jgi:hypothetical protein
MLSSSQVLIQQVIYFKAKSLTILGYLQKAQGHTETLIK